MTHFDCCTKTCRICDISWRRVVPYPFPIPASYTVQDESLVIAARNDIYDVSGRIFVRDEGFDRLSSYFGFFANGIGPQALMLSNDLSGSVIENWTRVWGDVRVCDTRKL
jgi:hypothetical protein